MAVNRWRLSGTEVGDGIESNAALLMRGASHADHIEMGGRAVNAIVQWEAHLEAPLSVARWVRWPSVRKAVDDTYGAFGYTFSSPDDPLPWINGEPYAPGSATAFRISGYFSWDEAAGNVAVRRTLFPSTSLPCLIEKWEIRNAGERECRVEIPCRPIDLPQARDLFKFDAHVLRVEWVGSGRRTLMPGEVIEAGIVFSCRAENEPPVFPDLDAEYAGRCAYRDHLLRTLSLTTPDPVVDRLFSFSKLRAAENVVATRGGLMHSSGGFSNYLGAMWCNDQNEYASPFFPFLGNAAGNASAFNGYQWFSRYQNEALATIPSSIIAEGRDAYSDAGDRGDAAMTAYGASRWALANGDPEQARAVWPFIRWCLEVCERNKTERGLIASDSDELEGRFSTGRTNLATACLTYDALRSAAYLAQALGERPGLIGGYSRAADALEAAIEAEFSATIQGYETYRYHEGLETLRAWICFPLVVGIGNRASGTTAALFSPMLWTEDGLLTEPGTTSRWDRSTLYALRGVFTAGLSDLALAHLRPFAQRRLLGDHVPYCLEAYPEGNQSQLSAESGLFCRIITEGILGIRPTGFDTFTCTPQLPQAWPVLTLERIQAFGREWNIHLSSGDEGNEIELIVTLADGRVAYRARKPCGAQHQVRLQF